MLVNVFKPVRETFAHTPIYYVPLESLLPHEDDDMDYPHTKTTDDNIHQSSGRPGEVAHAHYANDPASVSHHVRALVGPSDLKGSRGRLPVLTQSGQIFVGCPHLSLILQSLSIVIPIQA